MKSAKHYFSLLLLLLLTTAGALGDEPTPPWMKPRALSNFETLLQHSPFSLATAEDSSPLSERYMLTGIVNLDGEEEIFVMDRQDQSRELLTKKPNAKGMTLVKTMHDDDPNKLKATIRINGETGVINNIDLAESHNKPPYPGAPTSPHSRNNSNYPVTQRYPVGGQMPPSPHPPLPPPNYGNRTIIRRPPIAVPSANQNSYQPVVPTNYPPPPSHN
jgi:hypothetical protein